MHECAINNHQIARRDLSTIPSNAIKSKSNCAPIQRDTMLCVLDSASYNGSEYLDPTSPWGDPLVYRCCDVESLQFWCQYLLLSRNQMTLDLCSEWSSDELRTLESDGSCGGEDGSGSCGGCDGVCVAYTLMWLFPVIFVAASWRLANYYL